MIIWNIVLSIILASSVGFSVYLFILNKRLKKAIMDIISPELELHKAEILKILKKL